MVAHRATWLLPSLLCALASGVRAADPSPAEAEFFEKEVRPLLVNRCQKCHGDQKTKGDLRLDSLASVLKGGASGPAVVPGQPEASRLIRAIRYTDSPKMPPKEKLADADIVTLTRWVQMGLPWPETAGTATTADRFQITAEQRRFWSFQPVKDPPLPPVKNVAWPLSPIDRFILAKLEEKSLIPVQAADKRVLLRRATFDLTGLPPTPEEVEAFVADPSPQALEKVIDRLLASRHYGERWGRHWLDIVRYADTAGETADFPVPDAHRYRNYVIDAFNADKPYDQFIKEQIAGDILARSGPREKYAERVIATGYLASARRFGFDPQNYQHLTIEDSIDTLGKSILGLTISCARCHDHKFDPIGRTDYYALYGIFDSTRYPFPGSEENKRSKDFVSLLPPGEAAPAGAPGVGKAYAVAEGTPHNARIHKRGDPTTLGEEVPRRFLQILHGQPLPTGAPGSGRLQLAESLASADNPLTARVLVNRLWQHHFGEGLVRTPSNFGKQGRPPTHPELLDYLATRFMAPSPLPLSPPGERGRGEGGWSIKAMHKQIMLSRTYQLSSASDSTNVAADPANEWLWHFQRRRLDAESIRDALLAVSGTLDRTPAGPHPFPAENTWNFTQHNPFEAVYPTNRRSVYLMTQRLRRHPFLALFDGPDPSSSTAQRSATTVPTQALFFINNPFLHEQSLKLAERLLHSGEERGRIDLAHQLTLGRPATPAECQAAEAFLRRYMQEVKAAGTPAELCPRLAWAGYARVLFSSNEFIYID
jgi:hypothetical protein